MGGFPLQLFSPAIVSGVAQEERRLSTHRALLVLQSVLSCAEIQVTVGGVPRSGFEPTFRVFPGIRMQGHEKHLDTFPTPPPFWVLFVLVTMAAH